MTKQWAAQKTSALFLILQVAGKWRAYHRNHHALPDDGARFARESSGRSGSALFPEKLISTLSEPPKLYRCHVFDEFKLQEYVEPATCKTPLFNRDFSFLSSYLTKSDKPFVCHFTNFTAI